MTNFDKAIKKVLIHEGGYVNDPHDPGGETYKGISRRAHPDWSGWRTIRIYGLDGKQLQSQVSDLYRAHYWNMIKGDEITSYPIAESIFDFAVNSGVRAASRLAQTVAGASPDGFIGVNSIVAINQIDEELFLASYTLLKIDRYIKIVKHRPESRRYFYGWIRRAMGDIT